MKTTLVPLAAMAVAAPLLAASLPFARPGVIDSPNADILQHTQFMLGGSFTAFSYETEEGSSESEFALAGHLEVGLFDRGQLGLTYLHDGGISGNAKVLVLRETIEIPGIAVGCQNITGEEHYEFWRDGEDSLYRYDESQWFSGYLVVTKNLDYLINLPICMSVGYGIGRFRQAEDAAPDGLENPMRGLFGSLESHPAYNFDVALEWDGRDLNLGVGYRLSDMVRFTASAAELEQLLRPDERDPTDVMQNVKVGLGVEVTFGPFLNRTTLQPFEELTRDNDPALLQELEAMRASAREVIQELQSRLP